MVPVDIARTDDKTVPPADAGGAGPLAINAARLRDSLVRLSGFGAHPEGGSRRIAFSEDERAARQWLLGEMRAAGLRVRTDPAGNLFGRREGREPLPRDPLRLAPRHGAARRPLRRGRSACSGRSRCCVRWPSSGSPPGIRWRWSSGATRRAPTSGTASSEAAPPPAGSPPGSSTGSARTGSASTNGSSATDSTPAGWTARSSTRGGCAPCSNSMWSRAAIWTARAAGSGSWTASWASTASKRGSRGSRTTPGPRRWRSGATPCSPPPG